MSDSLSHGRRRLIVTVAGMGLLTLGGAVFWFWGRERHGSAGDQALEVDVDSVIGDGLLKIAEAIRLEMRRAGSRVDGLSIDGFKIRATVEPNDRGDTSVERILRVWPEIVISNEGGLVEAYFPEAVLDRARQDILQQTLSALRADLSHRGFDRNSARISGSRCILMPREVYEAVVKCSRIASSRSALSFRKVDLLNPSAASTESLPWIKDFYDVYPGSMTVRKRAITTGQHIVDAQVESEDGNPIVVLRFDIFTRNQRIRELGPDTQLIAIILDDQIVATVLAGDLHRERTVLRGPFSRKKAEQLALRLRSISLPAPLNAVEACPAS